VKYIKEQNEEKVFRDFFENRRKRTLRNRKKTFNRHAYQTLEDRSKAFQKEYNIFIHPAKVSRRTS